MYRKLDQSFISDRLLVSAGICCPISVIGISVGRAISILFGINGVRNQQSHLVGPPFPEFKAHAFFSYGRLAFLERLN